MPNQQEIYQSGADPYEELVAREDYQGHILPALNRIYPLAGRDVVELGAGTGRLTGLLAPQVRSLRAFDRAAVMLAVARQKLTHSGLRNWSLGLADNRAMAVADGSADVVISGWSIGYLITWNPQSWREELTQALADMRRALRPGGVIMLLETQGTGHETPQPPAFLLPYYAFLEQEAGFASTWIRTDYQFTSAAEAERLIRFFFGDALADRVVQEKLIILPECTGIWWLHRDG